jgi:hypothetical protein
MRICGETDGWMAGYGWTDGWIKERIVEEIRKTNHGTYITLLLTTLYTFDCPLVLALSCSLLL